MAFKRLSMRKIHRVLRLFFEAGLSIRAIARSIQVSPSTVGEYIRRANTAGLSWPLPDTLDERALDARLFPAAAVSARVERPIPDWSRVHAERRRKGVTLALLSSPPSSTMSTRSSGFPILITSMTTIVTAKLNDVDPQARLADVLARIAELPHTQVHELLPWNLKAPRAQALAA